MSYKIIVVNLRTDRDCEIISRPSVLGNPFPITKFNNREKCCNDFCDYFYDRVHGSDQLILGELRRLHQVGKRKGILKLGCFCKQSHREIRCHGDTIKKWLEDNYDYLEMLEEMS